MVDRVFDGDVGWENIEHALEDRESEVCAGSEGEEGSAEARRIRAFLRGWKGLRGEWEDRRKKDDENERQPGRHRWQV